MARRTALALSVWYSLCDLVYGAGVLIQERSTLPQVTVQGNGEEAIDQPARLG